MTGLFSYPKRKLRKLISQGEYEQAIEFGNELEAKTPKDPDLLFIMGSMFYILNDEKKTLHYIDRVLAVSYTHLTLPTSTLCRSRWSPYH